MATTKKRVLGRNLDRAFRFRHSLSPETDRGCALMAAAHLDDRLLTLLRGYFTNDAQLSNELLDQSRPLGSFSARIDMACALGLISAGTRKELHIVRKIRNEFGHKSEPLLFTSPGISDRCRALRLHNFAPHGSPRQIFTRSVMGILAAIDAVQLQVRHRRVSKDWVITEKMRRDFSARWQRIADALGVSQALRKRGQPQA